jgi:hypothetical protein
VQDKARGSAVRTSFKGDLLVRHFGKEVLLAFRKHFKLGQDDGLTVELCKTLGEETVAVAADFQDEVGRHLITPDVIVEELRIDTNLGPLLRGLGIGQRRLRVEQMKPDVIDTGERRSIGQYDNPDTRIRRMSESLRCLRCARRSSGRQQSE